MMNGRVGNRLQSFLPIALVVSWLMLAKRKRESFVLEAWYSVLAAKIRNVFFFFFLVM